MAFLFGGRKRRGDPDEWKTGPTFSATPQTHDEEIEEVKQLRGDKFRGFKGTAAERRLQGRRKAVQDRDLITPALFRALPVAREARVYGNLTLNAMKDVVANAKAAVEDVLQQGEEGMENLRKRTQSTWDNAVVLRHPGKIFGKCSNGYGVITDKLAGVKVYAIIDGNRRAGFDWKRCVEKKEKKLVLFDMGESERRRGVNSRDTIVPFFFDPTDAEAALALMKAGNPSDRRTQTYSVDGIGLDEAFVMACMPRRSRPSGITETSFLFIPRMQDVEAAHKVFELNGIEGQELNDVPLFQAKGLTVPIKGNPKGVVPLFFSLEDCVMAHSNAQNKFSMQKLWGAWDGKDVAAPVTHPEVDVGGLNSLLQTLDSAKPTSDVNNVMLVGPGLKEIDESRTERLVTLHKQMLDENPKGTLGYKKCKDFLIQVRMRDLLGGFASLKDNGTDKMLNNMLMRVPKAFKDLDVVNGQAFTEMKSDTMEELKENYSEAPDLMDYRSTPVFNSRRSDPWVWPTWGDKLRHFDDWEFDMTADNSMTRSPRSGLEEWMVKSLYGKKKWKEDIIRKQDPKTLRLALDIMKRIKKEDLYEFKEQWQELFPYVPLYQEQGPKLWKPMAEKSMEYGRLYKAALYNKEESDYELDPEDAPDFQFMSQQDLFDEAMSTWADVHPESGLNIPVESPYKRYKEFQEREQSYGGPQQYSPAAQEGDTVPEVTQEITGFTGYSDTLE